MHVQTLVSRKVYLCFNLSDEVLWEHYITTTTTRNAKQTNKACAFIITLRQFGYIYMYVTTRLVPMTKPSMQNMFIIMLTVLCFDKCNCIFKCLHVIWGAFTHVQNPFVHLLSLTPETPKIFNMWLAMCHVCSMHFLHSSDKFDCMYPGCTGIQQLHMCDVFNNKF